MITDKLKLKLFNGPTYGAHPTSYLDKIKNQLLPAMALAARV